MLTVEDTPSLCVLLIDTCGMLWSAYGLSPSDEAKGGPEEPLPLSLVVEALIMFANTLVSRPPHCADVSLLSSM